MLVVRVILSVIALELAAAGSQRPKDDEKHSRVEVLLEEGVVETEKKRANGRKPDPETPCLPANPSEARQPLTEQAVASSDLETSRDR
jgi:hypothetical protein